MPVESVVKNKSINNEYPVLMFLLSHPEMIVLFSNIGIGTVVSFNDICNIGTYSSNWETNKFVPFDGEIILKNK
jgi:hypothetical protein